jgi:CheY-like chemotaxis protein
VDDESIIRDIITDLLLSGNHEFHLADGGTQALEVLRKKKIDLVIVDRNMPGMSGIDLVKLIRQNPKTATVKILMCTGSSVTREVDEAFNAGADDYILKPLNYAQLIGKVAKALAAPPSA